MKRQLKNASTIAAAICLLAVPVQAAHYFTDPPLDKGWKLFLNMQYEDLTALAVKSMGKGKRNAPWYELIALVNYHRRFPDASIAAGTAVRLEPKNAHALSTYAFVSRGSQSEAVHLAQKAVALSPKEGRPHAVLALCLMNMNKVNEARKEIEEAVRLSPTDFDVNRAGTIFYANTLEEEKARHFYDALAKNFPTSAYVFWSRAEFRKDNSDPSGALSDYSRAIELNPKNQQAYAGRAQLYMFLKQYAKAAEDYTHAFNIMKSWPVISSRANAYMEMKQYDKAIADLNFCIWQMSRTGKDDHSYSAYGAGSKDYRDCWLRRMIAYQYAGRDAQVIKDGEEMIRHEPHAVKCHLLLHASYMRQKKFNEALKHLNALISLDPEIEEWYNLRSEVYRKLGRIKEANTDAEKASSMRKTGL